VKAIRAIGVVAAVAAVVLSLSTPAEAQTMSKVAAVKVPVTAAFTDSGLTVKAGDEITIRAGGTVRFQGGSFKTTRTTGPGGIPTGPQCSRIARQVSKAPFPVPGLPCYSLIGKIGVHGKPFEVGAKAILKVRTTGRLFLGINDNYVGDNAGFWYAAVTGASGKGNIVAAPATSGSGSKSSISPIITIVVGVLVAALLAWWAISRRRKPAAKPGATPAKKAAPKPKPKPEPEAVLAAAALRRTAEERAATAPIDPESSDVNIFKVELLDPSSFQVGYNFFPEGTTVHWRVADNGAAIAAGEFVTAGGGSLQHYETVALGTVISDPREVEVSFSWSIRDVPFSYSVQRSWQH
jgi:hypothetical protein